MCHLTTTAKRSVGLLTEAAERKRKVEGRRWRGLDCERLDSWDCNISKNDSDEETEEKRNPIRLRFADWVGKGILHAYLPVFHPTIHLFIHPSSRRSKALNLHESKADWITIVVSHSLQLSPRERDAMRGAR